MSKRFLRENVFPIVVILVLALGIGVLTYEVAAGWNQVWVCTTTQVFNTPTNITTTQTCGWQYQ